MRGARARGAALRQLRDGDFNWAEREREEKKRERFERELLVGGLGNNSVCGCRARIESRLHNFSGRENAGKSGQWARPLRRLLRRRLPPAS